MLFSVGGATNPVVTCDAWAADEGVHSAFSTGVAKLVATYGFDGFDLDLEIAQRAGSIEACNALSHRRDSYPITMADRD